jgi:DNA-binding XRE family transcriptional regulator
MDMKKDRKSSSAVVVEEQHQEASSAGEAQRHRNNVRKIRESLLMSKAELARKAGLSALTIDRIEAGFECRMDTKRKIILALGMRVADKDQVFDAQEPREES